MLELDRPVAARPGTSAGRVRRLLLRVEQLEHALGRRDARLQQVRHRAQLAERLRELPRVLDERLHVAEGIDPPRRAAPPTTAIAT